MELRYSRPKQVALLIMLGVIGGLLAWLWTRVQGDGIAATQCRQLYAQATTARDSAAVDRQRPIVSRPQAGVAASCGMLRREGRMER